MSSPRNGEENVPLATQIETALNGRSLGWLAGELATELGREAETMRQYLWRWRHGTVPEPSFQAALVKILGPLSFETRTRSYAPSDLDVLVQALADGLGFPPAKLLVGDETVAPTPDDLTEALKTARRLREELAEKVVTIDQTVQAIVGVLSEGQRQKVLEALR